MVGCRCGLNYPLFDTIPPLPFPCSCSGIYNIIYFVISVVLGFSSRGLGACNSLILTKRSHIKSRRIRILEFTRPKRQHVKHRRKALLFINKEGRCFMQVCQKIAGPLAAGQLIADRGAARQEAARRGASHLSRYARRGTARRGAACRGAARRGAARCGSTRCL